MLFRELNLIPTILSALQAKGYETPTPIQAAAIPPVLEGKDLLGCAQTGTGKTAAFALPILQTLAGKPPADRGRKYIRALILAPTRELALQIGESFQAYGRDLNLRLAAVFGGVSDFGQKQKLRQGVDILVATPGRLMDLHAQRVLSLDRVEIFVLDEADRMLDMGFVHDVRRIAALLPAKRQTLLFSATMPPEIRSLSQSLLHAPVMVEVARVSSTADNVDQAVYHVPRNLKPDLLRHLLADANVQRALVFTRTKHGADRLHKTLDRHRIAAEALHGNKTQGARQRALENFKRGKTRVLVATDIAARGIDVTDISHVFNYDLPEVPETYVHRVGRTARAGATGMAVAFCDVDERGYLHGIERLTRKRLDVLPLPVFAGNASGAASEVQADPQERPLHPSSASHRSPRYETRSQEPARTPQSEHRGPEHSATGPRFGRRHGSNFEGRGKARNFRGR